MKIAKCKRQNKTGLTGFFRKRNMKDGNRKEAMSEWVIKTGIGKGRGKDRLKQSLRLRKKDEEMSQCQTPSPFPGKLVIDNG